MMVSAISIAFASKPSENYNANAKETDYPVTANETENIKAAKKALDDLVRAFERESLFTFFNLINNRFNRGYLDFKDRVENDFQTFDVIRIEYFIDDIEAEGNNVSINFHWDRSWMPQMVMATAPILMQGQTQFIFEVENGKATLNDQTGAAIFGVTP